jgi:hypothetical protein
MRTDFTKMQKMCHGNGTSHASKMIHKQSLKIRSEPANPIKVVASNVLAVPYRLKAVDSVRSKANNRSRARSPLLFAGVFSYKKANTIPKNILYARVSARRGTFFWEQNVLGGMNYCFFCI